jgi:PIN domain nuclease of toxin-antitoxin system
LRVFVHCDLWEVAMLDSKGRIGLGIPCEDWLHHASTAPGISVSPLSLDVAMESCRLPKEFHSDPADRIIVATARVLGATLVTADQKIIDFGGGKLLNVLPV